MAQDEGRSDQNSTNATDPPATATRPADQRHGGGKISPSRDLQLLEDDSKIRQLQCRIEFKRDEPDGKHGERNSGSQIRERTEFSREFHTSAFSRPCGIDPRSADGPIVVRR